MALISDSSKIFYPVFTSEMQTWWCKNSVLLNNFCPHQFILLFLKRTLMLRPKTRQNAKRIQAKRKDLILHRRTKSDQSLREKFSLSLLGPVRLCHKYPALHHSLCQLLSSELDYIKFCYWKIFSAASPGEVRSIVTRFLHGCKIPAWEHSLSVPFCDSRESGLMLALL